VKGRGVVSGGLALEGGPESVVHWCRWWWVHVVGESVGMFPSHFSFGISMRRLGGGIEGLRSEQVGGLIYIRDEAGSVDGPWRMGHVFS
jgi:hypothetical protein